MSSLPLIPNPSGANHFDAIIIGAGMSGLAAGIRLAQFDKKVLILEKHNAPGGLNSFYSFDGRKFDVGLHALTNFVPPNIKGTPLGKIFRQLRISRDQWDLGPQRFSSIRFGSTELKFTNDFSFFIENVSSQFPKELDNLNALKHKILEYDEASLLKIQDSARKLIGTFIKTPLLLEMLLCPVMYYGSAWENDMPFGNFAILFRALFLEGLARPFEGVRAILRSLTQKYKELGGQRRMKCGVRTLKTHSNRIQEIELESGELLTADHIVSSAGFLETLSLCTNRPLTAYPSETPTNSLSFVETMTVYKEPPANWGWLETIVFFNDSEEFHYRPPQQLIDPTSGVICIPNNYLYSEGRKLDEGILRITALANYKQWSNLSENDYHQQKEIGFNILQKKALRYLPPIENKYSLENITVATDMFTPRTIHKYTGHLGGAIYGSSEKTLDGRTPIENLYICGTDQGLVGITGALLSGITMANLHVLAK